MVARFVASGEVFGGRDMKHGAVGHCHHVRIREERGWLKAKLGDLEALWVAADLRAVGEDFKDWLVEDVDRPFAGYGADWGGPICAERVQEDEGEPHVGARPDG